QTSFTLFYLLEEILLVVIVFKDVLPVISPLDDVVYGIFIFYPILGFLPIRKNLPCHCNRRFS
ncbi:MAG: hypothetical protein AB1510_12290, partial [Bacillota bacterium]